MILQIIVSLYLFASAYANDLPSAHPQPQFRRQNFQLLSDARLRFDDEDQGEDEHWERLPSESFPRELLGPYPWESPLSGINETGELHRIAWIQWPIHIPRQWSGQRITVNFGAVDFRAKVWVNGNYVGDHMGGHTPFRFNITRHLRTDGRNVITLRAYDPSDDLSINLGKQLGLSGIFYHRSSGPWQPIWLEATGHEHLRSVRPTYMPDSRAVRFEYELSNPKARTDLRLRVNIRDQRGRFVTRVSAPPERFRSHAGGDVFANIPEPKLWSPESPHLYRVQYELVTTAGEVLDTVDSYVGLRTIRVSGSQILLNEQPIALKFIMDQGYRPPGHLAAASEQEIIDRIRTFQDLGFNGARIHQKVEDPRYLYWADRLGWLVASEMGNRQMFTTRGQDQSLREMEEVLERDYAHPSIIMWEHYNESWGLAPFDTSSTEFRDLARQLGVPDTSGADPSHQDFRFRYWPDFDHPRMPLVHAHWRELYQRGIQEIRSFIAWTKARDGTRLVMGNDGFEDVGHWAGDPSVGADASPGASLVADVQATHDYATGETMFDRYRDVPRDVPAGTVFPDNPRHVLLPGAQSTGRPFLLWEFGGVGYADPRDFVAGKTWGYPWPDGFERTKRGALLRLLAQMEAIGKLQPLFSGWALTQAYDTGYEVNGLARAGGELKYPAWLLREVIAVASAANPEEAASLARARVEEFYAEECEALLL